MLRQWSSSSNSILDPAKNKQISFRKNNYHVDIAEYPHPTNLCPFLLVNYTSGEWTAIITLLGSTARTYLWVLFSPIRDCQYFNWSIPKHNDKLKQTHSTKLNTEHKCWRDRVEKWLMKASRWKILIRFQMNVHIKFFSFWFGKGGNS